MEHSEFVQVLRNVADFFEARPELGVPTRYKFCKLDFIYSGKIGAFLVDSKEGLAEFARLVGGKLDKEGDDSFFRLIAEREGFSITALAYRNSVCEKVAVGEKLVEGRPAEYREATDDHMEPVYEWRCPSILAPEEPEPVTQV